MTLNIIATQVWRYTGGVLKSPGRDDRPVGPFQIVTPPPPPPPPPPPSGYDPLTFGYGAYGSYKPSMSTTGLPAGSPALTVITGTSGIYVITTPNARFDLVDFQCEVQVRTTGVVITRSRFRGNLTRTGNTALLNIPASAPYGAGTCVTVYDSEFAPTLPSVWWSGIYSHDYTLHRCRVSGVVDPFGAFGKVGATTPANVAIYGCYTDLQSYFSPDDLNHATDVSKKLAPVSRTHNDIIQWQGGSGLTIIGNYLRGYIDPAIGEASYSAASPNPTGGGPNNTGGGVGWNTNYPDMQINSAGMQISGVVGGDCSGLECRNNWWSGCNRILTLSQNYPSVGVVRDNIIDHDQRAGSCFNVPTGSDIGSPPSLLLANNVYSNDGSPVIVLHV